LGGGATTITAVLPRSPAALAGLRPGDIVAGLSERLFGHARQLRPIIVSTTPGTALPLAVLRAGKHVVITPVASEVPVARR
jgi:serine protease Do